MKKKITVSKILIHGFILLYIVFLLFPLLWVGASSSKINSGNIFRFSDNITPTYLIRSLYFGDKRSTAF